MLRFAIFATVAVFGTTAAAAQEEWRGAPVLPAVGSAGVVSGSEYVTASCNLRAPGNYRCADAPNAVREVYIPLSSFARSSSVEAVENAVAGLQGQIAGLDSRVSAIEAFNPRRGIAAAVAVGNAPMPSSSGRTSYDFNLATFRGHEALGGSLKYRLGTVEPMAVSVGFAAGGRGNNVARVGLSGEF